jgi:hypothetical protein
MSPNFTPLILDKQYTTDKELIIIQSALSFEVILNCSVSPAAKETIQASNNVEEYLYDF